MQWKIGSFNMNNFSAYSTRDFGIIESIIQDEGLDAVALQEVLSDGKGLRSLLTHFPYGWDYRYAVPSESSDPDKVTDMIRRDKRGEGYAYLWNKKRFKLAEYTQLGEKRYFEPRIINSLSKDVDDTDCSVFARTPYYIRLEPLYGGFFELRLVNIHIYYGDQTPSSIKKRINEFNTLTTEIYPEICSRRYGQFRPAYTIAMGDYNLNIYSPDVQAQAKSSCLPRDHTHMQDGKAVYILTVMQEGKAVNILTVQDSLTTLKDGSRNADPTVRDTQGGYANNFDHFTYSPELSRFRGVSWKAVDGVSKYCGGDYSYYRKNVSDHLPIVITIDI